MGQRTTKDISKPHFVYSIYKEASLTRDDLLQGANTVTVTSNKITIVM